MDDTEELKNEAPSYAVTILKIRFRAQTITAFGVIQIYLNVLDRAIGSFFCAISFSSPFYDDINLLKSWRETEDTVDRYAEEHAISVSLTENLEKNFSLVNAEGLETLFTAAEEKNPERALQFIAPIISEALNDAALECEALFETADSAEVHSFEMEREARKERMARAREETLSHLAGRFERPEGALMIAAQLLLAPVNGIPIRDIENGDEIVVRIAGDSETTKRLIAKAAGPREKNAAVPAIVVDRRYGENGEIALLLYIAEKVYAVVVEAQPVKIKRYQKDLEGVFSIGSLFGDGKKKARVSEPSVYKTIAFWGAVVLILGAATGAILYLLNFM